MDLTYTYKDVTEQERVIALDQVYVTPQKPYITMRGFGHRRKWSDPCCLEWKWCRQWLHHILTRHEAVIINRLRLGHSRLTHS